MAKQKQNLSKKWKRLELLQNRFSKNKIISEKLYEDVNTILATDEMKNIISSLGLILLKKYDDLLEAELRFAIPLENNSYTSFNNKEKMLYVDPIQVIQFWRYCKSINLEDEEHRANEKLFCKASFLVQLSKLPSRLFLFLIILKQLAVSANLNQVNYTEGILPHDDTSFYQTILWAFNSLEKKIEQLHGVNIRTQYSISWHQSEWITLQ